MSTSPEEGRLIQTGGLTTNYHDVGAGPPVLLLHGSGPGVSAWANWRLTMRDLSTRLRLIAPDLAGFGYTQAPDGTAYTSALWLRQVVDVLDALDLEQVSVVGNSFGGSLALSLAIAHPERVVRLVLMGSVGVPFTLTPGLDAVWGYQPSVDAMGRLLRETFAYDPGLVSDDLVEARYRASLRTSEAFASMFPAPRQRWIDALSHSEASVRSIACPALIVHGRDDTVIPLTTSVTLHEWIDDSQLHVFGRCGHWTQIEKADEFAALVGAFLAD